MCISLSEIANCETYVNNEKLKKNLCKKCEDGYYLDNSHENQECKPISTNNCATAEDNTGKCLTCKSGYGLASNKNKNICLPPFEALAQYCLEEGIVESPSNVNNFQCNKCQEGASPLVLK